MTSIRTTIHNRRIEIPAPDELADGTEVEVELRPVGEKWALDESEWDDSPEAIADWIQLMNSLEPLEFTEEELAELEADRQARKQWEESHFFDHADELAKEFS